MKEKSKIIVTLFTGLVVGFILSIIFLVFIGIMPKKIEHLVMIISYSLISLSVFIALFQFIQNNKKNRKDEQWNEKYLAFTKVNEYIKDLEKQRTLLDRITIRHDMIKDQNQKVMSFSDRRAKKTPLQPSEVHQWVCKDGSTPDDCMCSMTMSGTNIVRALISIINTYELIATGIKKEIFNRNMILELMGGPIVSNYEFMNDYIHHRRTKHEYPEFASEWELLYKDIKKG